jgi:alpha-N-arabinofuranosidase
MPGGNNLEGNDPPYYWKWNETIGPLKDRPGYPGTWGYENTNGLGLVEYLQWCEDLEMEPGKHNFFQILLLCVYIT